MVIYKAQQVLARVQAPLLGAELAVQAVADLVHVARVEARIQALVALVVRYAVAGVVVHPAVVVSVQRLTHQCELRLDAVGQPAQLGQKAKVEAVGNIQTQAVDVVVPHPAAHNVKQVIFHRRVLQIQLDQLVAALPRFIPEAVVVVGVAVKADVEPVLVRAVPALLLHVLERPEATAHMVEHAVKQDFYARRVQRRADLPEIVVCAQAAVHLIVVAGVIAVGVALEQRVEQHAGRAQALDVLHPVQHPQNAVLARLRLVTVVLQRCAAKPQRVDLINYCLIVPHVVFLPELKLLFQLWLEYDVVIPRQCRQCAVTQPERQVARGQQCCQHPDAVGQQLVQHGRPEQRKQ